MDKFKFEFFGLKSETQGLPALMAATILILIALGIIAVKL